MKKIFFLLAAFVLFFLYMEEERQFFSLDSRRCITVWKTFGGTCYIIPGKYWGLFAPGAESYIQTSNQAKVDVIWKQDSDTLIINKESAGLIINKPSSPVTLVDYNQNRPLYDRLYQHTDSTSNPYKTKVYNRGVQRILVDMQANRAWNNSGEDL